MIPRNVISSRREREDDGRDEGEITDVKRELLLEHLFERVSVRRPDFDRGNLNRPDDGRGDQHAHDARGDLPPPTFARDAQVAQPCS